MPDENTPGVPGQGEPSGRQEGDPFDYQRGYEQLRPEYTRVTQDLSNANTRLSEYEELFAALHDSDPEIQRQAMEALGLELETGPQGTPGDDEFVDPLEQELSSLRSEVQDLRSARELEASAEEQRKLDELRNDYIGEALTYIEESLKPQFGPDFHFTEGEEQTLGDLAIAMSAPDQNGMLVPDVQGAFNRLYGEQGVLETNRERWIATKNGAAQAPLGTTIPADQKPRNRAERVAYVDERMRVLDEQQ